MVIRGLSFADILARFAQPQTTAPQAAASFRDIWKAAKPHPAPPWLIGRGYHSAHAANHTPDHPLPPERTGPVRPPGPAPHSHRLRDRAPRRAVPLRNRRNTRPLRHPRRNTSRIPAGARRHRKRSRRAQHHSARTMPARPCLPLHCRRAVTKPVQPDPACNQHAPEPQCTRPRTGRRRGRGPTGRRNPQSRRPARSRQARKTQTSRQHGLERHRQGMSGNAPGKAGTGAETPKSPMKAVPRSPVMSADPRNRNPEAPRRTNRLKRKPVQAKAIPHNGNTPDDTDQSPGQTDQTRKRAIPPTITRI